MDPVLPRVTFPDRLDIRRVLRGLLVLLVVSIFVPGPQHPIGTANFVVFDPLFLVATPVSLLYVVRSGAVPIPRIGSLYAAAGLYFGLALSLPAAGLFVYGYPLGYVVGDVRWVQLLFIGVVVLAVYSEALSEFVSDLELAFTVIVAVNVFVFGLQLSHHLGVLDTSAALEFWHANRPRLDEYGYARGRFSGAHAYPSGLGLTGALGVAIFARSVIVERRNRLLVVVSLLFPIVAGHRTSMVATVAVLALYGAYLVTFDDGPVELVKYVLVSALLVTPVLAAFYYFNVGQLATPRRYSELVDIVFHGAAWQEVSGRGGRWDPALQRAATYPVGTLANPAHVFGDLRTIDSYFVITYVQGGAVFLLSYLGLLATLAFLGIRLLPRTEKSLLPISFVLVAVPFSLMQNFVTAMSGKMVLILAVLLTLLAYQRLSTTAEDDLLGGYLQ